MTAVAVQIGDRPRARAAAETAVLAVALGLLADLLFREAALGLNTPLWIGALIATLLYTGRHRQTEASSAELACLGLSFAAAAALAWRGSPALNALLFLASGAFVVLAVAVRCGLPWRRAGVAVFAGALVAAGIVMAAGVHRVQSSLELRNRVLRRSKEGAGATVRIVVLAVPVLLVFALLFASADAVFEDQITSLARFDLSPVASHLFWLGAGAWFAGGAIWAGFEGRLLAIPEPQLPDGRRLKPVEVGTILGSLAVLFAAFVAVQLRYLFGGHDVVQQTIDLTYAEYARRGFFELAAAATLLLPLLLIADWARRRGSRADAVYRLLAGLLVALLFVVMASALQRMSVYEEAYGLTEPRLYVVAFLVWLAAVFALFLRTLLVARNDWFVAGSVAAAAAVLAVLAAIGPDALIARRNIDRDSIEHPFDAHHAAQLGADATPTLVRNLGVLAPDDACIVARALLDRWGGGSGDDLRSWNWSRSAAARAVERESIDLERACDARP
ncbi:MAG: DUF4173 domain-containing protein [Dehalococcoidia bacterium]|nr:DUF4173 domain-containing protein [Dehalococcoidia bacterium]